MTLTTFLIWTIFWGKPTRVFPLKIKDLLTKAFFCLRQKWWQAEMVSASNDLQKTLDKLKRKERRKGAGQGFLAGFGKGFNLNLGSSPQPIQQPIAQTQSTTNVDPQKAGFSLQTEQGNWQVYAFIGLIGLALIMYGVNAKKGKDMDAGVSDTPEIQPTTK